VEGMISAHILRQSEVGSSLDRRHRGIAGKVFAVLPASIVEVP